MTMKEPVTIAYQGAAGAFSHLASMRFADEFLKLSCTLLPCSSFEEVFDRTSYGDNVLACLPFENSTIGSIMENYEHLWESSLNIIADLSLPIHHQLLAIPGTKLEDVHHVYSHPVALEQCKNLFKQNAHLTPQPYFDTGAAAQLIKNNKSKDCAAIAARQAATEYDLDVIVENVEDYPENHTRFALIAKPPQKTDKLEPPFKLSIAVETSGSLNKLASLTSYLDGDLKLIKIESLPIPQHPWNFRLFLDFMIEGNNCSEQIKKLLSAIEKTRFYGCYKTLN